MITDKNINSLKPNKIVEEKFLKLINVGLPTYDGQSDSYVIFCCFQPWSIIQDLPSGLPVINRAINIDLAGILICGSLWTDSVELKLFEYKNNCDFQVFWSGSGKFYTHLLKDIISSPIYNPQEFWLVKGDTWVICIKFSGKCIIIPYFELLRALFYSASSRLTSFLFSFLPLNSLCRPVITPKKENSWYGAFYVASLGLTALEARVLGGLLFEPALKNIFDLSQTHWLFPTYSNIATEKNGPFNKLAGNFNISILFNASGHNFIHNGDEYFWVNSLEIISSPYNFREILFHSLQRTHFHSSSGNPLPACSELLKSTAKNINSLPDLYNSSSFKTNYQKKIKLSDSKSRRNIQRAKSLSLPFPYVMHGLSWAVIHTKNKHFHWLDEDLAEKITRIDGKLAEKRVAFTKKIREILNDFKANNYCVKYLNINNPNSVFGKNVSVFPINRHPPIPIALYKDLIKTCILASIELSHSTIFLIQPYPDENPELIIFCQKQDLSIPSDSEWNNLFDIITTIHNRADLYNFSKQVKRLNRKQVSTNSGLIAIAIPYKRLTIELCISLSNHILSCFRKRLQFYIAATLKYPGGMTHEQQKELILLSRNMCQAPNAMWLTTISNYWSELYQATGL